MAKGKQAKQPTKEEKPTRESRPTHVRRRRLRKVGPLVVRSELKRADFLYRWANDEKNRIEDLVELGYTFTLNENNEKVSRIVNGGSNGTRAYLMKIEKEIYEDYQAQKEETLQEYDKAMGSASDLTNDGVLNTKVYN